MSNYMSHFQCGKSRNESKDTSILDGTFRNRCNYEYIHPRRFRGCKRRIRENESRKNELENRVINAQKKINNEFEKIRGTVQLIWSKFGPKLVQKTKKF